MCRIWLIRYITGCYIDLPWCQSVQRSQSIDGIKDINGSSLVSNIVCCFSRITKRSQRIGNEIYCICESSRSECGNILSFLINCSVNSLIFCKFRVKNLVNFFCIGVNFVQKLFLLVKNAPVTIAIFGLEVRKLIFIFEKLSGLRSGRYQGCKFSSKLDLTEKNKLILSQLETSLGCSKPRNRVPCLSHLGGNSLALPIESIDIVPVLLGNELTVGLLLIACPCQKCIIFVLQSRLVWQCGRTGLLSKQLGIADGQQENDDQHLKKFIIIQQIFGNLNRLYNMGSKNRRLPSFSIMLMYFFTEDNTNSQKFQKIYQVCHN